MPSTQIAANERRNDRTLSPHTVTNEPPKLKTTLKTPPKQATNPLQFVKVGPCSLYRTAQEQLQKVQEVKKIKQEIRDDPEDWQSNLDNWKSSRRKRQEHIIERVVEVKKLELEEHDRQRRRSKTFSEMIEERGHRGRKLSISLAMYNEEDANDLSDLGIGTSSGKSSVSGDTHDDTHSVLSDRECEVEKSHSNADNGGQETDNGVNRCENVNDGHGENENNDYNSNNNNGSNNAASQSSMRSMCLSKTNEPKELIKNGCLKNSDNSNCINRQEYDSGTTATAISPELEECTYAGTIRDYVSHVPQNIPRHSVCKLDATLDNASKSYSSSSVLDCNYSSQMEEQQPQQQQQQQQQSVVKVDIEKRREVFEQASRNYLLSKNNNNNNSNRNHNNNNNNNNDNGGVKLELPSGISIKERLSNLERQKNEMEDKSATGSQSKCLSDFSAKKSSGRAVLKSASTQQASKLRELLTEELEGVKPLRERLFNLEKLFDCRQSANVPLNIVNQSGSAFCSDSIKDRFMAIDVNHYESGKRSTGCFLNQETSSRGENFTRNERSLSPDFEYRISHSTFHPSLDSLVANTSSEPVTLERVQSIGELEQKQQRRQRQQQQQQQQQKQEQQQEQLHRQEKTRLQLQNLCQDLSSCSTEILNKIDREDSEIQSSDANCSVNQRDEPIEEEKNKSHKQVSLAEEKISTVENVEAIKRNSKYSHGDEGEIVVHSMESHSCDLVLAEGGTADISCSSSSALGESLLLPMSSTASTNANPPRSLELSSSHFRPIFYQSPRVPPRYRAPEVPNGPPREIPVKSRMSPEKAGRSPSKIPTPLSRRQAVNSPRSPPREKETGPCSSPPRLSEIPVLVKASYSPTCSPRIHLLAETRRHTVLEVCEKVLVPRGQPQVTPFITVERAIKCMSEFTPECTAECSVECSSESTTEYDHMNMKTVTSQEPATD